MDPLSAIRLAVPSLAADPSALIKELPTPSAMPAAGELEGVRGLGVSPLGQASDASGGFERVLNDFVGQVNAQQAQAGDAVNGLLSGQQVPLHQAVIAIEEASVSFQLMVEVRNKLLESYQELMRMQV
jgi:flagellar hook-basal body complex protein FliE